MSGAEKTRHLRGLLVLAIATPLAGCSLLGLADFEPATCNGEDVQCEPLNVAEGIDSATACMLYQCNDRNQCVLRARDLDGDGDPSVECGGTDCDETDLEAFGGAPIVSRPLVTGVAPDGWIRWNTGPAGTLDVALPQVGGAGAWNRLDPGETTASPARDVGFAGDATATQAADALAIARGCPGATPVDTVFPTREITPGEPGTCTTHEECQDGVFCNGYEECTPSVAGQGVVDARGCRPYMPADARTTTCDPGNFCDEPRETCFQVTPGTCTERELAVSHARADELFAAGIHLGACPDGQVRIGWMSDSGQDLELGVPGPYILLRGPNHRAAGFVGIDVPVEETNASLRCTGGSRGGADPVRGASSIRLDGLAADEAIARRRPQALVAWLAAPVCRGQGNCVDGPAGATGPVEVEVIGAWHEELGSPAGRPVTWVSTSGTAVPQPLETRTSGIAPPALLAIDDDDDGYLVAYGAEGGGLAARFIPAFADPPGVNPGHPFPTQITPSVETRVTPPLADLGAELVDASFGAVDFVAAAAGPERSRQIPLLFAWLSDGVVQVAPGNIDAAAAAVSVGTATAASGASATPPEISFVEAGICGADCSGFVVSWSEGGTARVRRYSLTGEALDEEARDLGLDASAVRAVPGGSAPRFVVRDPRTQTLAITNAQCF